MILNLQKGKNVINFYDKDFDNSIEYDLSIESIAYCEVITVISVDDVFYCNESPRLTFTMPCLDSGTYKLSLINRDTEQTEKIFQAYYTSK